VTAPLPRIVLASGSPRRRDLLASLGLPFTVRPVDLDETRWPGEDPPSYVLRLAREKAATHTAPGELVLAADTVVVIEGQVLGKPADATEARAMLARLAGRGHTVWTGVAVIDTDRGGTVSGTDRSEVRMATLDEAEVAWYVATGEPLDKAGSYAIQGLGALYVEAVSGNYTNVVGLPLPLTSRLFLRLGWDLRRFMGSPPDPPPPGSALPAPGARSWP
jgi:septum formation protein